MRGWMLAVLGALGAALAWTPTAAADDTIVSLPSNERIAASMHVGRAGQPFSNSESSFALFALTSDGLAPLAPDSNGVDWSPGAASLVVSKRIGLDLTTGVEVVEFATRARHVLSYSSVQANTTSGGGSIDAVRWDGSGSPLWLLDSKTGLVRLGPDGGNPAVAFGSEPAGIDFSISSDGRKLLVARQNDQSTIDLFVVDTATGGSTQITNTPTVDEWNPEWSPDRAKVAYAAGPINAPPQAANRIEVANSADGTGHNVVYTAPNGFSVGQPAWRPDGGRIAFVRYRNAPTGGTFASQLMSVAATGGDERVYTPESGANHLPGSNASDLSWGSSCVFMLSCKAGLTLVRSTLRSPTLVAAPSVQISTSLGFLVQRYRGRRLTTVGRVPFGRRRAGSQRLRWNVRLNHRALRPGRYRITLRSLAGTVPLELARPVDLIVPRRGRLRLARTGLTKRARLGGRG